MARSKPREVSLPLYTVANTPSPSGFVFSTSRGIVSQDGKRLVSTCKSSQKLVATGGTVKGTAESSVLVRKSPTVTAWPPPGCS
eukprot:m.37723 g.37723  ORF g.37723 m.37723 type:complete len:84 (-) comp7728_c0_seq2:68-319(-)